MVEFSVERKVHNIYCMGVLPECVPGYSYMPGAFRDQKPVLDRFSRTEDTNSCRTPCGC